MGYQGGFFVIQQPLISGGTHAHTARLDDPVSDDSLKAINRVQAVGWRVNTFLLDVVEEAMALPQFADVFPSADPIPLPEDIDDEIWKKMSKEAQGAHKFERQAIHSLNASRVGKLAALYRKVSLAREMVEDSELFFPHFYDFRLRMYPATVDLHPQGDDVSKALLEFADQNEPLGEEGLYWLCVRLATCAGQDKLDFDARVDWVIEHHNEIMATAEDPLGYPWWATNGFDEPLGLLATCKEYYDLHQLEDPYSFVSHLPVNMDGSINGCQHLSLMTLDPVGAHATNCSSDPERQDLYMEVAAAAQRMIAEDAIKGIPAAISWGGKVDRKTVKRGVMTQAYGVTERGIRDQLVQDGFCNDFGKEKFSQAEYLTQIINDAVREKIAKGKEVMDYFQGVAAALAKVNIPFRWQTPNGSICEQSYYNQTSSKVKTLYGEFQWRHEDDTQGLNKSKAANGAAPNVVHSFDGAMLQMVINRLYEQYGVRNFSVIHDSYGVPAHQVGALHRVIREVAYDIYKEDPLKKFHDYILSYKPEHVEIPLPPSKGDFNLEEVLASKFFFS